MKEQLQSLYGSLLTFGQTITSFFYVLLFSRAWISRGMNKEYKDRNGKPASFIGNGPSLRKILDRKRYLLEDTDIMVVNYFGNTPEFYILKPNYYIILDPLFYDSSYRLKEELTEVSGNSKTKQLWSNFSKVDWDMTVFMPKMARQVVKENINNPHIKFVVFQAGRVLGYDWFQNWMYRHNKGCPCSRNISLPALITLINLGYKTIYMYGIDFSWIRSLEVDPENGLTYMNDRHFYSDTEIRHFSKGYYKLMLGILHEDLHGMDQIEKYAKSRGVRMINRTIGSYVDSFEYENPDTIKVEG